MALQLLSLYLELLLLWQPALCGNTVTSELTTNSYPTPSDIEQPELPRRKTCICHNGGTCILGSFCTCLSSFKGRYCEERIQNRSCGNFRHDAVQLDFTGNCKLCRCTDGTFICDDQYTCDDLTNYARLNPRINVAKGREEITLSMTDNKESAQDWLLILPHFPNTMTSSGAQPRSRSQHNLYIFLILMFKFLFFT